MLISLVAFLTIATAVVNQNDLTALVLKLALTSVASSWAVLTFSFAVYYARKDIEERGLEFGGSDEPAFSDYIYLAIGCSATFGTTDTIVTSRFDAPRYQHSHPDRVRAEHRWRRRVVVIRGQVRTQV